MQTDQLSDEYTLELFNEDLFENEALLNHLLPHIKEWIADNESDVAEQLDQEWCDVCDEFVEAEIHTISGRVGHIDNWLPDDHVGYCPNCDTKLFD